MTRYTYGGELPQVVVVEQGGVAGAALVLRRGPVAYPLYDTSGAAVTSFYLWDGVGYNTSVSAVNVDSDAFLPRFQVDNLTELRDAGGRSLLPYESAGGMALTTYTQVSTLSDYPTSFPPNAHQHTADQVSDSTAIGRSVLTAASAAAARGTLGAAPAGDTAATPNTTVTRTATGQVKVVDPVNDDEATSRGWVADALSSVTFSYTETMASAPSGSVFFRACSGGVWPLRGSTRTDIVVAWVGRAATDPAPPIGGTGAIGDDYWQKVDA